MPARYKCKTCPGKGGKKGKARYRKVGKKASSGTARYVSKKSY